MRVAVDTNVILSALMSINRTPAKILSLILNGSVKLLYDNRIIFEYINVLSRKEFCFPKEIIDDLINYIKHDGEYINSEYIKIKFSNEEEKKIYEVYKFGKAKYLITGNTKHFPNEETIVTPKDFMQIYEIS